MNLADEIRKQIEKNKELKLAVGEINNHLSVLERLTRKDIMEQVDEAYQTGYDKGYADKTNNDEVCKNLAKDIQDEAYQRGFEDGKAVNDRGCEGCEYAGKVRTGPPCISCCNSYRNQWKAKNDKIEVRDEVVWTEDENVVIVVTSVYTNDGNMEWCDGVCKDGKTYSILTKNARKTGRCFDIDKILEEMKE